MVIIYGLSAIGSPPAFAGSTPRPTTTTDSAWDHPRIRGEHSDAVYELAPFEGSPPHSRGARGQLPHPDPERRITPAFAGSTSVIPAGRPPFWDHPRIRGEHSTPATAPPLQSGSPPHSGEHPWPSCRSTKPWGSPPHSRGARRQCWGGTGGHGITPAFAGSTSGSSSASWSATDHPRIRGEHDPETVTADAVTGSPPHSRGAPTDNVAVGGYDIGSPPHSRGARHRLEAGRPDRGITPAFAGSTAPIGLYASWPYGSPPHSRGAHIGRRPVGAVEGITPAFAGST